MSERRPLWAWLFFPQLALVIGASALAATGHFPLTVFQRAPLDKLGHLICYGGLSFFGVGFFGRARRWPVILGLMAAATLEELSQRAFPARTFDLGDLAMNLLGVSLFGALAVVELGKTRSRASERRRAP